MSPRHAVARELERPVFHERGRIGTKPASLPIALIYPNSYYIGMSNMGFQLVYRLLNALPEVRAERCFLTREGPIRTVETGSTLRAFSCVGFSLSCEQDYGNVVEILRRAGIPLFSRNRDERFPLVMGGGVCASLNPEPIADIFDLFVIGEGEAVLGPLCERLIAPGNEKREGILLSLSSIRGVYVPRLWEPFYDGGGRLLSVEAREKGIPVPARQWIRDINGWPALAPVVTDKTEFGNRAMVEVARGCGMQCRFCVADYAYRPPRVRERKVLIQSVEEGLARAHDVALLGPSITDCPGIEEVAEQVVARGGRVSVSSVRADGLSDRLLQLLARGGLRSLTIAPETPAVYLQRKLNKSIPGEEIVGVAARAAGAGFKEIKLYYLFGIEGETGNDLRMIAEEIRAVASRLPVRVSVAPLIPKARTPLQWAGMPGAAELKERYTLLRKWIAGVPRVRMSGQSIRGAVAEATLARGDRRMAGYLGKGRLPRHLQEEYALRERGRDEIFPWEHIDCGVTRDYLWGEYQKFRRGELTPACRPGRCRPCGVCG